MLSGLGGALGGYWLAGRNEEGRDVRASQREETARRAALTERLEDQRHEIQRETLLELQDELQKLARATVQILHFDRNNLGLRAAGTVTLPDELDDGFSTLSVNRLKTRVLDRQLRDAIDVFTAICSRDATIPRGGEHFSSDDLKAAITQQLVELSDLCDDGRDELHRLGVTDVADLRSRREVERHGPGRVPDGVTIHLLPIPDLGPDDLDADGDAPHEHAFRRLLEDKADDEPVSEASRRYMTDEYSRFPTYNGAQQALHRVVNLLADGRSVLAHCFAGKDRTGFTVALVLEAAGVERDAIVADFLSSNQAVPQLRDRILEAVRQRSDVEVTPELMAFTEARLSDEVLGVREEYLDTARRTIDENFGSLDGYLRSAGITEGDVTRLRSALLA